MILKYQPTTNTRRHYIFKSGRFDLFRIDLICECSLCYRQILQLQNCRKLKFYSMIKCRHDIVDCHYRMSNIECQLPNVDFRFSIFDLLNISCQLSIVVIECRTSNIECRFLIVVFQM
jgi:hypothetical protein